MIDQSKKKALIQHIKERKSSGELELLLPPDLYFDGYDESHCTICANNTKSISTSRFAARLREVQQRPDVSGVFVRFYDYDDAEEFADSWIGSDSIYVVTTAGMEAVRDLPILRFRMFGQRMIIQSLSACPKFRMTHA